MKELKSKPQHGTHRRDQWMLSDWPTGHIYGCGRLIRNHFPGLERQASGTAAGQHWTPICGLGRWQLVTDSDTAIGLERPIYLMASPRAGDYQYFFTWTLVDDSARAKTIHFITAWSHRRAMTRAALQESLLSCKVNLMKCSVGSGDGKLFQNYPQ